VKRLLAVVALLCGLTGVAHAELGRDDQWSYVAATAGHGAQAELRGDGPGGLPSVLIFQIECAASERALLFRYQVSASGLPDEFVTPTMSLILGGEDALTFAMPSVRTGDALVGNLELTDELVAEIRRASWFLIGAPNDMGEAWQAGAAPAFRRLTEECWTGARR
jgi:hypothetical protein